MKKLIEYNNYSYYTGTENGKQFFNIVPSDQKAPSGGYEAETICKIKNLPNLFLLSAQDVKRIKQAVKELFKDANATPSSQTANHNLLLEMGKKCGTTSQIIFDCFPLSHFDKD